VSTILAISNLHDLILEIGSWAGLASVLGLGVLSALYFSQARDVKRLREWAGRAPERAAEQQIGGRPATQAAQAAQAAQAVKGAQAAQAGRPAAAPAPVRPAGAPAPSAAAASPVAPAAPAQPGAASAASGGGGTATAAPPRTGPPPVTPPRSIPTTSGQTAVISPPPGSRAPEPWYHRIDWPEPRYIALIVAGVLVIGAGIAFAITQLTGSSSSGGSHPAAAPGATGGTAGAKSSKPAPVDPSKVTVAVLNGTRIPGLAAQVGDRVQSNGFNLGNVATATEAQRAESVVEFKPGANRAARLLARKLHITQIEPLDPSSGDQGLSGDATVLVIVGADQQRGSSGGGGGGGSGSGGGSSGAGTSGTGGTGAGTGGAGTGGAGTGTPGAGTGGGTATTP
jgi:hypothetical protein